MIEIEPMQSTVSDEVLNLVASFCGPDVKDKLLYDNDTRNDTRCTIGGIKLGNGDSGHPRRATIARKPKESKAARIGQSKAGCPNGFPQYTEPCSRLKQKFASHSREWQLFAIATMGVKSCPHCREIHTLDPFLEVLTNEVK